MKQINFLIYSFFSVLIIALNIVETSCTSDIVEENRVHAIKMKLEGEMQDFDKVSTRAISSLPDGTRLLIRFKSGSYGTATYANSTEDWAFSLIDNSTLIENSTDSCTIYYSPNPIAINGSTLTLDSSTPLYMAKGTWSYASSTLWVKATLKPVTPRVHFRGASDTTIKLSGITYYNRVDVSKPHSLSTESSSILLTVNGSYTDYIYGFFTDESRELRLSLNNKVYSRIIDSSIFISGQSGYMDIPRSSVLNNWKELVERTFTVNGVSFTMIAVEGGIFTMGATPEMEDPDSDEEPTHQVTLSSFYIGETEVTQELWEVIMNNNPSKFQKDKQNPVENIDWSDCQNFITKLCELTGERFSLPTEAEWEYAARGGCKSQHTQYSGHNNLDEVAWYNSNSNNTPHPIKTKKPNELGIYDMTGNVWEWCQDFYGLYNETSQINPTGPHNGSSHVIRGGSYSTDAGKCRTSYRECSSIKSDNHGLRLSLSE